MIWYPRETDSFYPVRDVTMVEIQPTDRRKKRKKGGKGKTTSEEGEGRREGGIGFWKPVCYSA